jgi:hypothetical protein
MKQYASQISLACNLTIDVLPTLAIGRTPSGGAIMVCMAEMNRLAH